MTTPGRALRDRPSPNHDARRLPGAVTMLVLHYTGMPGAAEALERLCDPASAGQRALSGRPRRRHPPGWSPRTAAPGMPVVASWRGETDVNSASIGIEIVNPGHEWGYLPFPAAQMEAVAALCRDILARHPIPARHVLAHSDVAPRRKRDPGELFDWRLLARRGVGLWPARAAAGGPRPVARATAAAPSAASRTNLRSSATGPGGRRLLRPTDRRGGDGVPAPFPDAAGRRRGRRRDARAPVGGPGALR